jgi:hypothetical protein
LLDKNNTSKLLSKNVLKRKSYNLGILTPNILSIPRINTQESEGNYVAKQSVIEENISDANLLNSFDGQMHLSIRPGEKFLK